jgi:hypothetical protein
MAPAEVAPRWDIDMEKRKVGVNGYEAGSGHIDFIINNSAGQNSFGKLAKRRSA